MTKTETTGIGSLPFADADEAVRYVFSAYSVPFFPQLIRHPFYASEYAPQMLQEVVPRETLSRIIGGDPQRSVSHPQGSVSHPQRSRVCRAGEGERDLHTHIISLPAYQEFKDRLQTYEGRFFKLQLCGPLTAARIIEHLTKKPVTSALMTLLSDMIVEAANLLVTDMLAVTSASCIFIWDEGLPFTEPTEAHKKSLADLLRAVEGPRVMSGVHCCAPFSLSEFLPHAENRWLAADLSIKIPDGQDLAALKTIRQKGGLIAGIADTSAQMIDPAAAASAMRRLSVGATERSSGLPLILSGGCGTGLKAELFERELSSALKRAPR